MTCAQGLLRLLWGGPKLECYGTGKGAYYFALFHWHFVVSKQPVILTRNNVKDRNFYWLSNMRGTNTVKDVLFLIMCSGSKLFNIFGFAYRFWFFLLLS